MLLRLLPRLAAISVATVMLLATQGCTPHLPVLQENTAKWLQATAWLAAAVGAIVTAVKFWTELRASREQRERDLAWRQAEAGKSLNDEMQTDEKAWPALQMLDSDERVYAISDRKELTIRTSDIPKALMERDIENPLEREKFTYIRDCFDNLFYYFAIMDHYIASTLIRETDISYPLEYYVPRLASFAPQVVAYLHRYNLHRAEKFLNRYSEWRDATNNTLS